MPKIKNTPLPNRHESRSVHAVGGAVQQRLEHPGIVIRRVLEVGVLEQAEVSPGLSNGGLNRSALARILLETSREGHKDSRGGCEAELVTPHRPLKLVEEAGRTSDHRLAVQVPQDVRCET